MTTRMRLRSSLLPVLAVTACFTSSTSPPAEPLRGSAPLAQQATALTCSEDDDRRFPPLDPEPDLRLRNHISGSLAGANARQWNGDARGHWEGNTLVVETTNYNNKGWIATNAASGRIKGIPISEALRVVERFTRVDSDTIEYEMTVDDPNVYTKAWKVSFPMSKDANARVFEYACQEGNYAMTNILSGARAEEKATDEAAKKQK
jgi:hypothetical protein